LNGSFLYPKGRRQRGGQAPCTTTAIRFSYYFVCYANLSKNSLTCRPMAAAPGVFPKASAKVRLSRTPSKFFAHFFRESTHS